MARMNELQCVPQPRAACPADAVGHEPKVVLVLGGGVPRLVQELHFGGDDGRPIRAPCASWRT